MSICSSFSCWVRAQDFFGHQVSLNFDRKGDTHNTIIGGTFSIFIRCFITWYVSLNCYKLLTYANDSMSYTESLINLNQTDAINYSGTNFYFYGVLKNLYHKKRDVIAEDEDHVNNPIFLDEGVERYIQILFIQSFDNWYEGNPENWFKRDAFRAK